MIKDRYPKYSYNVLTASTLWLKHCCKYYSNTRLGISLSSIIDADISIIEDIFRHTDVIQCAFFKQPDHIIPISVVSIDEVDIISSETIGKGSFGVVMAGKLKNKNIAVKLYSHIKLNETTKQHRDWCTCVKEYALLCRLQGTGIVGKLYGAGWIMGCWTMVMERHYIQSIDWKYHTMNTTENTKQIVYDIFDAISRVHELTGYVHGDVKPSNIMIDILEGKPTVRIIDFGLSEPIGILRQDHRYVQSMFWRSPELLDEEPCDLVLADAWATAITAFDIMAGKCIMFESGASAEIDEIDMSNLLVIHCLGRVIMPDEWKPHIHKDLIDFANDIYAKYIVRENQRFHLNALF